MFRKLLEKWYEFLQARRTARAIRPKEFVLLASDLRLLAESASKIRHPEPEFQSRVKRIQDEMRQLEQLADRPEFAKLPREKRLELRKSLILSRQQLIEYMQDAPSPTDVIQ